MSCLPGFWLDRLAKKRLGKAVISAYGLALAAILVTIVVLAHQRGGTRGMQYGPTIGNQFIIANEAGADNRDDVQCGLANPVNCASIYALTVTSVKDNTNRIPGTDDYPVCYSGSPVRVYPRRVRIIPRHAAGG